MRKARAATPHKRDGVWYLIKRVPKEYAHLDRRDRVKLSTGILVSDDPRGISAKAAVSQLDLELQAYWRGLRDGQSAEAGIRFEAARRRAMTLGLPYQTADELADGRLRELLQRIAMISEPEKLEDENLVAAVLGGEQRPALKLSNLVESYEELMSTTLAVMSPDQLKRWRNPKKRAVENLTAALGDDKEIAALTRSDGIAFRRWWQKRIADENLDIGTANKDFGHVSRMLHSVDIAFELGLKPIFTKLRIEGAVKRQRAAFDAEHLRSKILAPDALGQLNAEAAAIVWVMADTGLRLSEAANLLPEHILLDAEVPHLLVRAAGRKLKTDHSAREIPLVGHALAALKRFPNGFPRYRDKGASLSALLNKTLGEKGLLPTEDHSAYSLRHTFEDRLTAVEAPEKIVATLMGHKWMRPKYGAGPSLAQKQEWLEKIAFKPTGAPTAG